MLSYLSLEESGLGSVLLLCHAVSNIVAWTCTSSLLELQGLYSFSPFKYFSSNELQSLWFCYHHHCCFKVKDIIEILMFSRLCQRKYVGCGSKLFTVTTTNSSPKAGTRGSYPGRSKSHRRKRMQRRDTTQRLEKSSVEIWVPTSLLGRVCVCVWFDPPVKSHHNWEIELHYPEGPAGEAEVCECSVAQSCPTLWDPVGCSPPVSSVHGILQPSILEWVSISYSRGSSPPRDQTSISLTHLPHWWAGSLA